MACTTTTCNRLRQCTWRRADRVGATASLLCAIHCAALPLVIGLLPLVGLEVLADPTAELAFVVFACALASTTIVRGWVVHRDARALRLLVPGVALLLLGQAIDHGLLWHAVAMACGGTLVASAHFLNLRIAHAARLIRATPAIT